VLQDEWGSVRVLASGHLLVSSNRAHSLELAPDDGGPTEIRLSGSAESFRPGGGSLRGLSEVESRIVPDLLDRLDRLARGIAEEVNRAHARGVGLAGSFTELASAHVADPDQPLALAGLPFSPSAGSLFISVTDTATGQVEQRELSIEPARQSLRDIADLLGGISGIRTSIDHTGRLHIRALPGHTFDFSDRVDPNPGSLGSAAIGLAGRFGGPGNSPVTLRAVNAGQVGVTEGLEIEVLSSDGSLLRTLDVGLGYSPGSSLELAPGLRVSLDTGVLAAGDEMSLQLVSEPDEGGFLSAIGMNALFVGGSAAELRVDARLTENPELLATGRGGSAGDNGVVRDLEALRDHRFATLDDGTPDDFYGLLIGDVGQQRRSTETLLENENGLVRALEARRDEVAGVSVDEEMVDLIRYQRSFEAAAKFLSTMNEVTELLVSI
jgi:flagellar hook-associated protein 1 FlgK